MCTIWFPNCLGYSSRSLHNNFPHSDQRAEKETFQSTKALLFSSLSLTLLLRRKVKRLSERKGGLCNRLLLLYMGTVAEQPISFRFKGFTKIKNNDIPEPTN